MVFIIRAASDWSKFTVRLNIDAQLELDRLDDFDGLSIAAMQLAMAAAVPSINWRSGNGVLRALLQAWEVGQ